MCVCVCVCVCVYVYTGVNKCNSRGLLILIERVKIVTNTLKYLYKLVYEWPRKHSTSHMQVT